jgi:hypothetical protein
MDLNLQLIHAIIDRDIPHIIGLINEGANVNYEYKELSGDEPFGDNVPIAFCFSEDSLLDATDYTLLEILINNGARFSKNIQTNEWIIQQILFNGPDALDFFYKRFGRSFLRMISKLFMGRDERIIRYDNLYWILTHIHLAKIDAEYLAKMCAVFGNVKSFALLTKFYPQIIHLKWNLTVLPSNIRKYIQDIRNNIILLTVANRKKYNINDVIRSLNSY